MHSPAPRVSARLNFAVISLSKEMDRETTKSGVRVGTSSTANAVPLPLIGATADAVLTSSTTNVVPLPLIGATAAAVLTSSTTNVVPLPLKGKD